MRFSRFRNQMEGTTGSQRAANRKKNAKGKKVEKGEMIDPRPAIPPTGLKMEPADYSPYGNPVKCEPNGQKPSVGQQFHDIPEMYHWGQHSSTSGPSFSHQMHPFLPQGMSYPMMSSLTSSNPMTPMSPPAFYPPYPMPQDFNISDMGIQQPNFPNAPMLSWEPPVSPPDQVHSHTQPESHSQSESHTQPESHTPVDSQIEPESNTQSDSHVQTESQVQPEPAAPPAPATALVKIEDDTESKISVKMEPYSLE